MRSLQLFLGAYLAGEGYAEHTFEDGPDEPARARLFSVPGLPLTWQVVMRRKRHAAALPKAPR
jgi:hypothetical protein